MNVVEEMRRHVQERGINKFVFLDDVFNVPKENAREILRHIIKELPGVQINFPNGLRADCLDEEMLQLLEDAGTVQLAVAVETASPRLQKIVGKNLNISSAKKWIQLASEKFIVCTFFMIGFPTETLEEALETINLARDLKHVSQPVLSIVRLYPGTALYAMLAPDEEQARLLARQEGHMLQPRLLSPPEFYGDIFPEDKVPLRGKDIQKLRWKWMREVLMNKERIRNSHVILQKFFNRNQILEFYKSLYDNSRFNELAMAKLLQPDAGTENET